jgi:hypothetical protein
MPHTATMRYLGGLLAIGLFATTMRWLFDNWRDALDALAVVGIVLAVAAGALLVTRLLVGFLRGVARGFREGVAEARRPGPDDDEERQVLAGRLAVDMRQVADRRAD